MDYLFNGKEFNEELELNWLDYGFRWYDPAVGRFPSVDPLAANFPRWSSYAYVYNSPIGLLDPTGMSPEDFFSGLSAEFGDYKEKEVEARQNNFDGENSITAYLVNQIGVKNIPEIINEVDRIFRRNNILGTIHYKVIAEMDGFDLPSFLSYEDNSLFLALTNSAFGNLGVSDINLYTGRLAVWVHHKDGYCGFKSCVDVPLVKQYFPGNWKYNLGLIIAHEYSHQLDAFSRMFLFNDLEGLPYEGHYNFDTDNLLMGGQRFSGLKKGGDHELLLPIIREQILKYIDR
jgi:RHS repeat-associated protein